MEYNYSTVGTCAQSIRFQLNGDKVTNIQFNGGCPGNTQAVARLCDGMTVEQIEAKLGGIRCGGKPTSCSDQLAKAVRAAYNQEQGK